MDAEFPPLLPNIHHDIPGGPLVSVDEGGKSFKLEWSVIIFQAPAPP